MIDLYRNRPIKLELILEALISPIYKNLTRLHTYIMHMALSTFDLPFFLGGGVNPPHQLQNAEKKTEGREPAQQQWWWGIFQEQHCFFFFFPASSFSLFLPSSFFFLYISYLLIYLFFFRGKKKKKKRKKCVSRKSNRSSAMAPISWANPKIAEYFEGSLPP